MSAQKGTSAKVGWVLTGNRSLASSRLQGFRIHEYLVECSVDSRVLATDFEQYEKRPSVVHFRLLRTIVKEAVDIVFFQKPGWMSFKMSEILRLSGVRTVAIQCDPFPGEYDRYFDLTIVASVGLQEKLSVRNARVIDDMIESPEEVYKRTYKQIGERVRVVWVGQGTGPGGKRFVKPFLEQLSEVTEIRGRVEFITISRGAWATIQWSLDTVFEQICQYDVAIIPLPEDDSASAKSSNRLTMFMALGMPTIISPIESYLGIGRDGENCLIARNAAEFARAISELRSEQVRERIGTAARQLATQYYSVEMIGRQWAEVIQDLGEPVSSDKLRSSDLKTRLTATVVRGLSR